jgi:1,2-diacylglycerol 3-alpha-glucosyltransferase
VTETALPENPASPSDNSETRRIGMFSESFAPVQNGVTTSLLTLVSGLRARHHHVCIFAPAHQEQDEHEINVLRFPSFVSLFNRAYPLAYPFLPRLTLSTHFQRLRFDIVHTHTPFVLGLTGANLALASGVPLVSTFHTLYSQYTHYVPLLPEPVTHTLLETYLPWYYNRCAEIICPSEIAAGYLREQGIERPITVIPTGIPLPPTEALDAETRTKVRESLGVQPETPLLLYAGRLAKEKNIGWLLEVLARVRREVSEARLVIAGSGAYQEELKARAEALQLGDSVLFPGPFPHEEMSALCAACDVFCFPSPSETQGLVISEARAAGAPCVVVDAGGAPETVRQGEDGFRIPPDDLETFAAQVVEILQHESLRHVLRANALRNARNFTPERMVERALEVYERARTQPALQIEQATAPVEWKSVAPVLLEENVKSNRR